MAPRLHYSSEYLAMLRAAQAKAMEEVESEADGGLVP